MKKNVIIGGLGFIVVLLVGIVIGMSGPFAKEGGTSEKEEAEASYQTNKSSGTSESITESESSDKEETETNESMSEVEETSTSLRETEETETNESMSEVEETSTSLRETEETEEMKLQNVEDTEEQIEEPELEGEVFLDAPNQVKASFISADRDDEYLYVTYDCFSTMEKVAVTPERVLGMNMDVIQRVEGNQGIPLEESDEHGEEINPGEEAIVTVAYRLDNTEGEIRLQPQIQEFGNDVVFDLPTY
ncbi:hypothetical protein [Tetragenococcus halophilus]|uniref:hypothetical protein n=1 Tax=Tetragenococcus halophilus TaxID=51669 RepID=UPI0030102CAC